MANATPYPQATAVLSSFRLALVLALAWVVLPQGVHAQRGCDENPLDPDARDPFCMVCPSGFNFVGGTFAYTPSYLPVAWCSSIENDQFLVLFPDTSGRIDFTFATTSCRTSATSLQLALYDENLAAVSTCYPAISLNQSQRVTASALTPERPYLLRIDGHQGAECEFEITFAALGGGRHVAVDPTYGTQSAFLQTTVYACPTTSCTYNTTYELAPASAGTVVARPSGAFPQPGDNLITADWTSTAPVRTVLDEVRAPRSNPGSAPCLSTLREEIFSHFLDLSNEYLAGDTVFDCSGDRHTFLIAPGDTARILLLENAAQRYVVSGAGVAGTYFDYGFRQNNVDLRRGSLTTTRFADTLRVDFKLGAVVLTVSNPNAYPTELLFHRLAGAGTPYPFVQDCPSTSYQVCSGQRVFEFNCGVRDPLATTDWDDDCGGIVDLRDERLVNGAGAVIGSVQASGRANGWGVEWRLQFDRFAPPEPGNYLVRGVAVVPQGCAALGCVSTAPVQFEIPITISPASDTVRLPDVQLPSNGGAATLFAGVTNLESLRVEVPGEYRQAVNCVLYLQRAVSAAVTVNLGEQLICPGTCLTAPTGETFGCVPGTASFRASNDTIYVANVRYDVTESLVLREVIQTCDSITGEWTARIRWTGSRGPWFVAGVEVAEPTIVLGPTRESVLEVRVEGSSPCVESKVFRVQSSCRPSSVAETARRLGIELVSNPSAELEVRIAAGRWDVTVVDALGRRVLTGIAESGTQRWSESAALPSGSYFIDFRQNGLRATLPWIKL